MARSDELLRGVAIGLGAAVLVPVALMALAPIVRPVARSALKSVMRAYEKSREAVEELHEVVDDVKAEVEEELREAREGEAPADEVDDDAPSRPVEIA